MRKHIAFLLILVLLLSCTAVGYADEGSLAGSYKVTMFTDDGKDMSESLAMMDSLRMSIYLTIDESGTGEMSMMGEETEKLFFDLDTMTVRSEDDDDILYFTFEDGTITVNEDGDILVFSPIDAADVKTEAPDCEALFSGLLDEGSGTETSGAAEPSEVGNYTLKDTVVEDDENCSFVIQDVVDDGQEIELKVLLENKTDKNLMFSIDNVTVNGYVNDPFWAETVAAGKKAMEDISFTKSDLAQYCLLPMDELSFDLNVSDADDWLADYLIQERYTVYPTGKNPNDIIHPERITTPTEKVIYESANFCFIMLDESDGWFGHEYRVYIENNTDKNLAVTWDNVSLNDFMCDPFWGTTVPAYSRSYEGILGIRSNSRTGLRLREVRQQS